MTNLFSFNRKIIQSITGPPGGRKGNCWGNAVAESFFKTIKYQCLYRFEYTSLEQLSDSIAEYINWYNTKRMHSSLGYRTPLEMEIKLKRISKKVD